MLKLARELDSINLPTDSGELREMLARSALSFRGRARNRARSFFVFCAEERRSGRLVAASMIIAKHGTPESPHFYLEVDSDERYSHTLKKMFRHTYLRMRYSMDGPSELGGLIVTRSRRRHPARLGRQMSWVRFLYIARHRARFERRVLAEMLAPMGPGYRNLFWDHYGRRVTGLSFREADRLSTRDKEFIRTLFPESPLYTFLLPEEVRESLGTVGEATRGAVRLLEQAGLRFLDQLDPFDAGPYYGAEVDNLAPVRQFRTYRAIAGEPDPARARAFLIGLEDDRRGFRAVAANAQPQGGRLIVERGVLRALGGHESDRLDTVPLPL
jgi:arginine N-succinyltransferase